LTLPNAGIVTGLFAAGILAATAQSLAAPALIENVHGYTLTGTGLTQFNALAFDHGKVLATGNGPDLRSRYADAQRIDGHGATLLPGLIDAHGHILDMGMAMTDIDLVGTGSLAVA
jgi:predicted amidohydrolase YtcJ